MGPDEIRRRRKYNNFARKPLREAAKLKILQEEEAQLRWIFELIFKPKQRKSDLKKGCQVSFLRKIISKSRNLVKFLGVATLQSKLYAKQLEAENATWNEVFTPMWVDDGGQAMDGFFSDCI